MFLALQVFARRSASKDSAMPKLVTDLKYTNALCYPHI